MEDQPDGQIDGRDPDGDQGEHRHQHALPQFRPAGGDHAARRDPRSPMVRRCPYWATGPRPERRCRSCRLTQATGDREEPAFERRLSRLQPVQGDLAGDEQPADVGDDVAPGTGGQRDREAHRGGLDLCVEIRLLNEAPGLFGLRALDFDDQRRPGEELGDRTLADHAPVGTTILPINLLSFTADCNTLNQTVNINWSTASETNNDYFTIERSKDGETWEIVTVVKGAGNSNDLINYNVNDDAPSSTVSYYRLKQTDFNGVSNTFNPVAVSCNSNATDYFVLKPNPAIDEVTCSVVASEDNNATIEIINYLGQKICIKNCNLLKGSNDFKVDVSPFSNGMYTVIVYSSNGKLIDTKQLVVQKR